MPRGSAEDTRARILSVAQRRIHEQGFRDASIQEIYEELGLTKGALYHYFDSKAELGYAVVEEVLGGYIERFRQDLLAHDDPIEGIMAWIDARTAHQVERGCPVNNLAQEMSTLDEGFRIRIQGVFDRWASAIGEAFRRGQDRGRIRKEIDPEAWGRFVLAVIEGSVSMAKPARSLDLFRANAETLRSVLEELRPRS